jgi:hypothetical protein
VDYGDPGVEERWCNERRSAVIEYLQQQHLVHGTVGEWPAWHVAPYVSIWAIESTSKPGWVGWWVISGDLPTDYVSANAIKHPRDAIQAIAARWQNAAVLMAQGAGAPGFTIGSPNDWPSLAPLLESRAKLLQEWAGDERLWSDL